MTQQDLEMLASGYTHNNYGIGSHTTYIENAYQAGFKKALELVFESLNTGNNVDDGVYYAQLEFKDFI